MIIQSSESIRFLPRHPSISSTLPLTKPTMPADPSRSSQFPSSSTRVHGDGFADDEAIGNEFADGLAGVCVRDFVDFVGIEPDLALAATYHGGGEALLSAEVDPRDEERGGLASFAFLLGILEGCAGTGVMILLVSLGEGVQEL